jgi:hypothetical protein
MLEKDVLSGHILKEFDDNQSGKFIPVENLVQSLKAEARLSN